MLNLRIFLVAGLIAGTGTATAMPDCKGDWEYRAQLIEGETPQHGVFEAELAEDLTFQLQAAKDGLRVITKTLDDQSIPIRQISQGVAPVRGHNPVVKRFGFGPDVLDPALNPDLTVPGGQANAATVEPTPGLRGQVWLIDDAGEKRSPASNAHPLFQACVRWTYWPRTPDITHYPTPDLLVNFPSWVVMAFEDCGVPDTLLLSGRMPKPGYRQRAWLEPDLDGDGLYDLVALIDEPVTGRSGLAVCFQADKRLEILGLQEDEGSEPLSSDFLSEVDWWSVDGRTVNLGIEGAGSQQLHWNKDGAFQSGWVGD